MVKGKDVLTSGKGKDQFMFSNGKAFIEIRSIPFDRTMGVDKITDFEVLAPLHSSQLHHLKSTDSA